ncbi:unnamed protein product [Mytilus edulis]|uniref:MAM domain-containing protein n=1 Tax=Mytilus edulis TaxID=6550 RepID=A0A8S3TYA9_MYTED|nr:unnamed protein product [Mytilus edulis]
MDSNLNVILSFLHVFVYVFSKELNHTGFPEETFISNSSKISCAGNTTITIVDLNVEQYPTTCSEYKHCNLTEEEANAIKKRCNKKHLALSQRLFQRTVNGSCSFENELCGWSISSNGTYQWIRGGGKSPGNSTGPDTNTTSSKIALQTCN